MSASLVLVATSLMAVMMSLGLRATLQSHNQEEQRSRRRGRRDDSMPAAAEDPPSSLLQPTTVLFESSKKKGDLVTTRPSSPVETDMPSAGAKLCNRVHASAACHPTYAKRSSASVNCNAVPPWIQPQAPVQLTPISACLQGISIAIVTVRDDLLLESCRAQRSPLLSVQNSRHESGIGSSVCADDVLLAALADSHELVLCHTHATDNQQPAHTLQGICFVIVPMQVELASPHHQRHGITRPHCAPYLLKVDCGTA
jgi:hypothetical protein